MRALTLTFKSFAYAIALCLLLFALCLQIVRTGLYYIDDYRGHIESFLSERLSADVSLEYIRASWHGLRPQIELKTLKVVSRIDASTVEASHALIVLDLSDTFFQLAPVFKHVSFSDLTLSLSQNAQGAWAAAGFSRSNPKQIGDWRYRSPADLFSTVKFAELKNTQLKLRFFDGRTLDTVFPYTDITNDGDKHYLNISASIDNAADVFSIQIEGDGRPSQPDDFSARALVSLKQFPAERLSRLLFLDKALDVNELTSATLDAQFWFDFDTTRHFSMNGDFAFSGSEVAQANTALVTADQTKTVTPIQVSSFADIYQVPLRASVTADYQFNEYVRVSFQDIQADNDLVLEPINISLENNRLEATTKNIDLGQWSAWFSSRFTDSIAQRFMTGMAPRGELQQVYLSGALNEPGSLELQAYAREIGIDSYRDIPRFDNVSGYLQTSLSNGFVQLDADNFLMSSQPFFNEAFVAKNAQGEVHWRLSPADNAINIQGNALSATADFGVLNGYFDLDLPWQPNTQDINLRLQLGLQDSSAQYAPLFLPTVLPDELNEWLETAIKKGDINTAGVLYRGGFAQDSERSVQVYLDVDNAQLAYQPDWPVLKDVAAKVIFDDNRLTARIAQASTYDDITTGIVNWNAQSQNRLSIEGAIQTRAQSALRFVENSPLKELAGDTFSDWELAGDVGIDVDLLFGLGDEDNFSSQLAEINLSNNQLYLPQQNLKIDNANGTVFYSSDKGFSSVGLNGLLFDEQTLLDIKTQDNGDLLLSGTGGIGAYTLSQWLDQPLLSALSKGSASYTFDFLIPEDATLESVDSFGDVAVNAAESTQRLSIYSDLKDIQIDLPAPFGKVLNESKDFVLEASFTGDVSNFTIGLDENVLSEIEFVGDEGFTSFIQLSDQSVVDIQRTLPVEAQGNNQGLFIHGEFTALNAEPWLPFFDTLESISGESDESLPVFYNIKTESLQLMSTSLTNTSVLGYNNSDVWQNTIASDTFAGNIFYRETDAVPLTINLDYLLLAKQASAENSEDLQNPTGQSVAQTQKPDPLRDIEFADIPSANVVIKYLEYDGKALGDWSFDVDAQANVIKVQNIQASMAGLAFTGVAQGEGATLQWERSQGEANQSLEKTVLSGKITGGNVKAVFEQWGLPPSLDNEQLFGAINLQWAGSPAALTVESITGDIDFLIEDGVFIQDSSNTTGFLKVLSFLNFDTWIKRLRLDFSGLGDSGISFDNVSGRLNFNNGIIRLAEPVELNGSSLSLSLAGSVDYPQETIDGDLSVLLPVGGNLNFAAALAAGLPVAVGVYLVRKIFKDALEKVSTINYRISGDLNQPDVVFDNGQPGEFDN